MNDSKDQNAPVYLHIGMGKTGTSSLQAFLQHNSVTFESLGWFYPNRTVFDPTLNDARQGNFTEIAQQWLLAWKKKQSVTVEGLFSKLEQVIGATADKHLLFSSEYLFAMPEEFWNRLVIICGRCNRRLRLLAYVREQREFLLSWYTQWVKTHRGTLSADQFFKDPSRLSHLDYFQRFRSLSDSVGEENVLFRRFQKSTLRDGDTCRDFIFSLGLAPDTFKFPEKHSNTSPGLIALELMRALNGTQHGIELNHLALMRAVEFLELPTNNDLYRLVSPKIMQEINERFRESNAKLLSSAFHSETGPLFDNTIPDQYEPYRPEDRINEKSIQLMAACLKISNRIKRRKGLRS